MESLKEANADIIPNPDKTSPQQNKTKNISSFTPLNDKSNHNNTMSRQNSAFKNLKNDMKSDTVNIFPNTPRKPQNCGYFNSIISPFKDIPFIDSTPFKQGNYNISSPENLRFNSPMNSNVLPGSDNLFTKNSNEIQGKKIDFTAESIDMIKLNNKMPLSQTNNGFNNNRVYNNINNNLFSQNNINIINNNIDYSNQKIGISPHHNNSTSFLNNNYLNINSVNNQNNKCTCSKTGCKKKYCACFSRGKYCDGCECKNCENFPRPNTQTPLQNLEKIESNDNLKTQKVICNCTKSNCMKKYCECFKQGFNCNSLCRCWECKNNKVYINNNNMTINNNNENTNYNMKANINLNSNNKENNGYNNYMNNNNDSISTNNFYNYALHNNINNNIINNNIINNPYIPETFANKSLDYSNPMNFQSEAFGICIKNYILKYKPRKLNLNEKENVNMKEAINNNFSEINETPKFSNKKRLRAKNDNSTGVKTCPTTNSNSGNKLRKTNPVVNKHIKKKRLQLS